MAAWLALKPSQPALNPSEKIAEKERFTVIILG